MKWTNKSRLTLKNLIKYSPLIDLITTVAIVISLLFVGYEIRQNTKLARGQARQALAEINQGWLTYVSQKETNDIWHKVWYTDEEITPSEWRRGSFLMTIQLRRFENVFFQFSEGFFDDSALHSYGLQDMMVFRTPRFHRYWIEDKWRSGFDTNFVAFFEEAKGILRE